MSKEIIIDIDTARAAIDQAEENMRQAVETFNARLAALEKICVDLAIYATHSFSESGARQFLLEWLPEDDTTILPKVLEYKREQVRLAKEGLCGHT